jgi:hypothetical protein
MTERRRRPDPAGELAGGLRCPPVRRVADREAIKRVAATRRSVRGRGVQAACSGSRPGRPPATNTASEVFGIASSTGPTAWVHSQHVTSDSHLDPGFKSLLVLLLVGPIGRKIRSVRLRSSSAVSESNGKRITSAPRTIKGHAARLGRSEVRDWHIGRGCGDILECWRDQESLESLDLADVLDYFIKRGAHHLNPLLVHRIGHHTSLPGRERGRARAYQSLGEYRR